MLDVVIIGAGPTGLGLAHACCQKGLKVAVTDPQLDAPWPANYGVFVDEFSQLALPAAVYRKVWPRTTVLIDRHGEIISERPYATLDNDFLKAHFVSAIRESGHGQLLSARVSSITPGRESSVIALTDAEPLTARIVIDCSGHSARFCRGDRRPAQTIQVAYGVEFELPSHRFPLDRMVFLDYRDEAFAARPELGRLASFLYVFPYGPDRLFIEETNIGARPPVDLDTLKEKLRLRMEGLGLVPSRILSEEVSVIPLDPELPPHTGRIVAFGAASALVNPISGYLVTGALTIAPRLAGYLADALAQPGLYPEQVAQGAWQAVWPRAQRLTRRLRLAGLAVLRELDNRDSQDFFRAFFSLPAGRWERFLGPRCSPADAAGTMALHYLRLPPRLWLRVAWLATVEALRGVFGSTRHPGPAAQER